MNAKRVHLIGIGGIGMSGIARIYQSRGWNVQGSDVKKTELLTSMERSGMRIMIGHDASHINGADVVVYSSSIPEDHPERRAARERGLQIMHRAEALADICRDKRTIAIAGTHGKTTTTALVGTVLQEAGRDPSIVVGGLVISFGGNAVVGSGPEIVIEADESDSSFLRFAPHLAVVTNVEAEHLDHFGTVERVEDAFRAFIERLPREGEWFGCGDDPRVAKLAGERLRRATLYGLEPRKAGIYATDVVECPGGKRGVSYRAWKDGLCLGIVHLRIIGKHNVLNSLAAIGVGLKIGIPFETISRALGKYLGAGRRFDVRFEDAEFTIVDDYAHHPTELQKTLAAARALKPRRLFAAFQPHRYTRTRDFLEGFAVSFGDVDKLFVTDVYAASETPIEGVSGERLAAAVTATGHADARYVERAKLEEAVLAELKPGDLFLALGAGDVYQIAHKAAEWLAERRAPSPDRAPLFPGFRGKTLREEPLSKHTMLKVGGPAEYWLEPEDVDDLARALDFCRRSGISVQVIGAGSNLVAPDDGVDGAVIHLAGPYWKEIRVETDGLVVARAGVPNTVFIQFAVERSLGGCEFLAGIPGNVGGSVAMNAGSHKQSIDARVERVAGVRFDGRPFAMKREEIPFRYRASGLTDVVIAEAAFRLPAAEKAETLKRLEEYRDYRFKTQDLQHPSAGCMFKNPDNAQCASAGKLIDDAGLKGRTVGRAQVSARHANFIVNLGGASSEDVVRLIREVQEEVKKKFDVDLETEVKIL